jgi:hypothetical protein
MLRAWPAFALGVVASLATGCEAKPGDACKPGQSVCFEHTSQLVCDRESGKYVPTSCKGPKGCYFEGKTVMCDFSGNKNGDDCAPREDGMFFCADNKHALVCERRKWKLEECLGEDGCSSKGGTPTCEQY